MSANNGLTQRAQRLFDVLESGKDFIQEIGKENTRLYRSVGLLENSVSAQEIESGRLREQNRDFATRHVEMEQQSSNMANLYVASHQLHSTLDFKEVLQIVQEIVINFIGSECFGILLIDEETGDFRTIAAEGSSILPEITELTAIAGTGKLGEVIASGESYFDDARANSADLDRPVAVIPLKIKERVIGILAIYQLLQQKRSFSNTDYELFSLLAGQAATAIFSAKLYSDAERKLNTIQGFIDSLTTA